MKKFCVVAVSMMLILCLAGCKSSDYKKAVEDFNAGQYAAAMQEFQNLGDYQDSTTYVTKCEYAIAVADFESGKYEDAKLKFEALNGFEDSADYVEKCEQKILEEKYEEAISMFDNGDYEAAEQAFLELNGFEDSVEYAQKAEHALQLAAFVGMWKTGEMDIGKALTEELAGTDDITASLLAENPLPSLNMVISLEIYDDETYELNGTIIGGKEFSEGFTDLMWKLLVAEMEAELEAQGFTMQDLENAFGTQDMNEVFEIVNGMSLDEFLEYLDLEGLLNEFAEDLSDSGTFTVEGNAIVLDETDERYELNDEGTKLTVLIDELVAYIGTNEVVFNRG